MDRAILFAAVVIFVCDARTLIWPVVLMICGGGQAESCNGILSFSELIDRSVD
jgi:hypothetical protein